MTMKTRINNYDSYKYVEVFKILEYKNNAVLKTKSIGFANRNRIKKKDEIYSPLSTNLIKNEIINLELID